MTKLYLITGFLGAGKTTFLKKLVRKFPEKKIALIINEFGKNGVDGALLDELGVALKEINNGSIFCSCRIEQFEGAVQEMLKTEKPELIFVEASGLADPSAVRSIFTQPIYEDMAYAGAVCLVDAARFHKVYQSARVSRMQLAVSDLVLINKTDLAEREQIEAIKEAVLAQKPGRPVYETRFGDFEKDWLKEAEHPGREGTEQTGGHVRDLTLRTAVLTLSGFTPETLLAYLKMFADDTYRIKGFVPMNGQMYVADCVGPLTEVRPFSGKAENPGRLTVLYGKGMPAMKSIREAGKWFSDAEIDIESGGNN